MDDILSLTNIPDLLNQHKAEAALGCSHCRKETQAKQEDRESMLKLWLNNIGTGKQGTAGQSGAILARKAYTTLKDYWDAPTLTSPFHALVDEERIRVLGLDPDYIGAFFKKKTTTSRDQVKSAMYMAIFLNTVGASGKILMDAVMYFYDAAHICTTNAKMGGLGSDYSNVGKNMTTEDIKRLCTASLVSHYNKKEVTSVIEENRQEVGKRVADALGVPVFSAETLLTETCYQILEPLHAQEMFLHAASYNSVRLGPCNTNNVSKAMRGKRVDLTGPGLSRMMEDLFNVVLPRRFRLKNGMTVAFLDAFLDVLLGMPVEVKRAIHDVVSFASIQGLTDTDVITETLDCIAEQISLEEETDLGSVLVHVWTRQQLFVIWLEMVRRTVPVLEDLTVGCVDFITHDAKLPQWTLYYFRGHYYIRAGEKTYVSDNFKRVIEAVSCRQ